MDFLVYTLFTTSLTLTFILNMYHHHVVTPIQRLRFVIQLTEHLLYTALQPLL